KLGDPKRMLSYLPQSGATLVYLDIDGLRRAGILDLIAGSKAAEDAEYRKLVAATGFDYRRDLEHIAGAFNGSDVYLAVHGKFDWEKLIAFTKAQGGKCTNEDSYCRIRASQPGRWVSFYALHPNVIAIAFSGNEFAALDIAK